METQTGVELVSSDTRKVWEGSVLRRHHYRCANCGSSDRLGVQMVVPTEAGGRMVESNGTVLCRACEMALGSASRPVSIQKPERRLINFWVSRALYDCIEHHIRTRNGFVSLGHLIRFLMARFVNDPDRFDDLAQYQDAGEPAVKLNVRVDADVYDTFKALLSSRKLTVTDAVKALIQMYYEETQES